MRIESLVRIHDSNGNHAIAKWGNSLTLILLRRQTGRYLETHPNYEVVLVKQGSYSKKRNGYQYKNSNFTIPYIALNHYCH